MAFTVQTATIDLVGSSATLVATDVSNIGATTSLLRIEFPFDPDTQGKERDLVVAAAKVVLQQALNEIS
jgi:hypothetical protein